MDLICSYDENDFAFYDHDGEAENCIRPKLFGQFRTCANKAVYLADKRISEKLIENEHFKFEMEPEDCKQVSSETTAILTFY